LFTACLFTCLTAPGVSFAAPGDLITAFDTDGIVTSNPTTFDEDSINDVAIDASGIYIVGTDNFTGNTRWRIEKRDLTTGALITAFDGDGIIIEDPAPAGGDDVAYDIAVDATYIYVAGSYRDASSRLQWRIKQYNRTTGAAGWTQVSTFTIGSVAGPYDIAVDTTGIYVVGYDREGTGNDRWRVEKRLLTTGAVVWTQTFDPTVDARATAVAVDASGVYIAGMESSIGNHRWRLEKRNLTTGALITAFDMDGIVNSNPSPSLDTPTGIAVDSSGIYVTGTDNSADFGQWHIEKYNPTSGAYVAAFGTNGILTFNPSNDVDEPGAMTIDTTGIYVAGIDSAPGTGDSRWRIEKRNLTTGALDLTFGPDGIVTENPSAGWDDISAIVNNANSLYIGGSDAAVSNFPQWRVEKRDKLCTYCLDCGLRMHDGTSARKIICENPSASSLRVYKAGGPANGYGVLLTNPATVDASRFRVQTPAGVKALARYGDWVLLNTYSGGCYTAPPASGCTYTGTTWQVPGAFTPCRVGQTYCGCVTPFCSYSCSPPTNYNYQCQ